MAELETIIAEAVDRQDLPFAVGAVARAGGVVWEGAAGEASPGRAAGPDTLFSLFSMTKAFGALAVMIAVERGIFSLDTEVRDIVPVFDELQVLETMGPAGPVLRPARRPATVRHLLTHTSGLAIAAFNEKIQSYLVATEAPTPLTGTLDSWKLPLVFDPGDGWAYGIGSEWAGYMVQQATGTPIDQFCREAVFEPLGLTNTTFEVDDVPAQPAQLYQRTEDGTFAPSDFAVPSHPENYSVGIGIHSTAADYIRFLRMLLNDGELDGTRIIGAEMMHLIKEDQMQGGNVPPLETQVPVACRADHLFDRTPMTHSAMAVRTERDLPGMRGAGSLWWSGFLNTFFWIDPKNDVAAVLMTQSLPFCDPRFIKTWSDYERAAYRLLE